MPNGYARDLITERQLKPMHYQFKRFYMKEKTKTHKGCI